MSSFLILMLSCGLLTLSSSQSITDYCIYEEECSGLISSGDTNIYCQGDESCRSSELSVTSTIYSNGNSAASDSLLVADSYVLCYGPESCMNSRVYAYSLQCWTINSCAQVESFNNTIIYYVGYQSGIASSASFQLSNTNSGVYAYGQKSAKYADIINARFVVSYGDLAFVNADIVASGISQMYIAGYGVNGFRKANVYCFSGVYCQIVCESSGCKRLTVHIFNGATYEVVHANGECNDAPTIIESNSTDDDILIMDMLDKRQNIKSLVRKEIKSMMINEDNNDIDDLWDELFNKYSKEMKLYENENEINEKLNIKINTKRGGNAGDNNKGIKLEFLYILLGSVTIGVLFSIAALMSTLVKYVYTYIGDNNNNNGYDEIKSSKTYNIHNGVKYQSI